MQPQEQINLYIAEQPEWQRKALVRLRKLVHAVDEEVKECWRSNAPSFELNGSVIVSLHGLKTCVSAWFPKGALLKDTHGLFVLSEKDEDRVVRKYKVHEGEEIAEKAFTDLLKQAVNKSRAQHKADAPAAALPAELEQVLTKDEAATEQWNNLSADQRHAYVEWITDAPAEEIRKRRIAKALEMIREGLGKENAHEVQ